MCVCVDVDPESWQSLAGEPPTLEELRLREIFDAYAREMGGLRHADSTNPPNADPPNGGLCGAYQPLTTSDKGELTISDWGFILCGVLPSIWGFNQ